MIFFFQTTYLHKFDEWNLRIFLFRNIKRNIHYMKIDKIQKDIISNVKIENI